MTKKAPRLRSSIFKNSMDMYLANMGNYLSFFQLFSLFGRRSIKSMALSIHASKGMGRSFPTINIRYTPRKKNIIFAPHMARSGGDKTPTPPLGHPFAQLCQGPLPVTFGHLSLFSRIRAFEIETHVIC